MNRKHLLATSAALIVIWRRHRQRVRRERRERVQQWLLDRGYYGAVANLMKTVERRRFPKISAHDTRSFLPTAWYDYTFDTETRHDDARSH